MRLNVVCAGCNDARGLQQILLASVKLSALEIFRAGILAWNYYSATNVLPGSLSVMRTLESREGASV